MNDNIEQARDGCNKIHNTLMRKQLSVNHEHAANEKYLGDWVNELGCKEGIDDTIRERM